MATARLYNLARMTTATTGTGTVTLGSAVTGFLTFAQAGVADGATVTYAIKDGNNSEIGRGVYTSSGTTLSRATVLNSTNSNNALNLTGSAEVFITPAGLDYLPNINAQTGTTYTVLDTDLGKLVSHSNAAAIAVTLPQATGLFGANWFYYTVNFGAGTVTITPTTSTINGAATLVLATGAGAFIVSDGTNYSAIVSANLLAGLADPGADRILFWDDSAGSAAWLTLGAGLSISGTTISAAMRGYIFGLTLSNNASDATNDIDIAAGEAASDATSPVLMTLSALLTKRLDALWAVGSGNGGLDTGSIADTTYHVWLIQRSDTGVVDALFSTSATSPTMPTNYDRKRRIGSIIRASGAIRAFLQDGDVFYLAPALAEVNGTTSYGTSVQQTLANVPAGVNVEAMLSYGLVDGSGAQTGIGIFPDGITNPTISATLFAEAGASSGGRGFNTKTVRTDTLRRVRVLVSASGASIFIYISTLGWVDTRGRVS